MMYISHMSGEVYNLSFACKQWTWNFSSLGRTHFMLTRRFLHLTTLFTSLQIIHFCIYLFLNFISFFHFIHFFLHFIHLFLHFICLFLHFICLFLHFILGRCIHRRGPTFITRLNDILAGTFCRFLDFLKKIESPCKKLNGIKTLSIYKFSLKYIQFYFN